MKTIIALRYQILVLLFYTNLKLNIETQRGEVFDQLMIDSLRLFFISKTNRKKGLRTMSSYPVW